jgi:hypothetical protein
MENLKQLRRPSKLSIRQFFKIVEFMRVFRKEQITIH